MTDETPQKRYIKADAPILVDFLSRQKHLSIRDIEVSSSGMGYPIIVFYCLDIKMRICLHQKNKKGNYTGIRFVAIWHNASGNITLETVNKFNAKAMTAKAYIEKNSDVYVEWYVDLTHRIREEHFVEIFSRWYTAVLKFQTM